MAGNRKLPEKAACRCAVFAVLAASVAQSSRADWVGVSRAKPTNHSKVGRGPTEYTEEFGGDEKNPGELPANHTKGRE